jgi:uncharacterized SAM-binding protein YcdF (DUF218 family)
MISFDWNKSLPLLFLPLGLSLILLTAALRWRRSLLIATPLATLWLFGTPAIADFLMRSLEDRYPYRTLAECPHADAVFVFGGMLGKRDHMDEGIAWNEAAERFDRALRLVKAGKAGKLVLSGGPERYPGGPDEGDFLRQEAIALGVPAEAIIVTGPMANTEAEAEALSQLVRHNHWERVLLVTSAFHMPRAMRLTRRCTAERMPVPVAYVTPAPGLRWAYKRIEYYIPQAEALAIAERALREYIGILFYAITGH